MGPACCAMLILANVVLVSLKCERIYIWKKPRDLNFFLLFWVFSNCWLLVVSFLIMGSVISRSRKKIKNKTAGLLKLHFLLPPVWRQKKNFAVHVKSANENIENCQLWFVFFLANCLYRKGLWIFVIHFLISMVVNWKKLHQAELCPPAPSSSTSLMRAPIVYWHCTW